MKNFILISYLLFKIKIGLFNKRYQYFYGHNLKGGQVVIY